MAESVSYWICSCGKANLKSNKKCTICKKGRPRRWLIYAIVLVSAFLVIGMMLPTQRQSETAQKLPAAQRDFLSEIEKFHSQASSAPNSLALREIIQTRNRQIANSASPQGWSGIVVGVQSVQGKGGISVDIGGVNLLAGVHLSYGLDTLISSSHSAVYNTLLNLRRGDKVTFSGDFELYNGSLVEMSYAGQAAISDPEFLFNFRLLEPVLPLKE